MDASHLIAQLLGLVYTVAGVGIFLDNSRYKKMIAEFTGNAAFSYIGGVMALLCGYLIILFGPNIWEVSFEGLITLIGWIALVKGVTFLVRPDLMKHMAKYWSKNMQTASIIAIVLGLALSYYGHVL